MKKGDAVAIYMPMLVELPIAMLACARIGAVHSVRLCSLVVCHCCFQHRNITHSLLANISRVKGGTASGSITDKFLYPGSDCVHG